jgi:hypothetical protein
MKTRRRADRGVGGQRGEARRCIDASWFAEDRRRRDQGGAVTSRLQARVLPGLVPGIPCLIEYSKKNVDGGQRRAQATPSSGRLRHHGKELVT